MGFEKTIKVEKKVQITIDLNTKEAEHFMAVLDRVNFTTTTTLHLSTDITESVDWFRAFKCALDTALWSE